MSLFQMVRCEWKLGANWISKRNKKMSKSVWCYICCSYQVKKIDKEEQYYLPIMLILAGALTCCQFLQIWNELHPPVTCGCNEAEESNTFSHGSNTSASLFPAFSCPSVSLWMSGLHDPLQAVIHAGLFQTMPLYWSPFIMAAGCLRDAGALWQILRGGSTPAASLYEETQLEYTALFA